MLILLKNITCYIQEVLMVYVGQAVIRDLRNELYLKMTAMPMSFFHRHKAGELISRATNDVQIANKTINVSFTNLVRDLELEDQRQPAAGLRQHTASQPGGSQRIPQSHAARLGARSRPGDGDRPAHRPQ